MTEDLKKLETLDYRAEYEDVNGRPGKAFKPTSAPPATLGMNSHVIKARVNKAEDAGQPTQKECDDAMVEGFEHTIGKKPILPEQPNLKIIGEIEGLISQVNEKLYNLDKQAMGSTKHKVLVRKALEEIDLFQKTMRESRKAFED